MTLTKNTTASLTIFKITMTSYNRQTTDNLDTSMTAMAGFKLNRQAKVNLAAPNTTIATNLAVTNRSNLTTLINSNSNK